MAAQQPVSSREVKMQAEAQSVNSSKEVPIVSENVWPPKLQRIVLGR